MSALARERLSEIDQHIEEQNARKAYLSQQLEQDDSPNTSCQLYYVKRTITELLEEKNKLERQLQSSLGTDFFSAQPLHKTETQPLHKTLPNPCIKVADSEEPNPCIKSGENQFMQGLLDSGTIIERRNAEHSTTPHYWRSAVLGEATHLGSSDLQSTSLRSEVGQPNSEEEPEVRQGVNGAAANKPRLRGSKQPITGEHLKRLTSYRGLAISRISLQLWHNLDVAYYTAHNLPNDTGMALWTGTIEYKRHQRNSATGEMEPFTRKMHCDFVSQRSLRAILGKPKTKDKPFDNKRKREQRKADTYISDPWYAELNQHLLSLNAARKKDGLPPVLASLSQKRKKTKKGHNAGYERDDQIALVLFRNMDGSPNRVEMFNGRFLHEFNRFNPKEGREGTAAFQADWYKGG